jgi:hypothetical protein
MTEHVEVGTAATPKAKREVKTIVMTDGREVEFAGKRRLLKTAEISEDGFDVTIRLDFVNGETRSLSLAANKPLFAKFAAHGMLQKLGDEVAGLEDVEDMVIAEEELISRLEGGEWGAERTKSESSAMAGLSVLAKALVEVSGKTAEQVKSYLKGKTNSEKLALRANPTIKPIIEKLEAAKKQKPKGDAVDTDALLEELGGGDE